MYEARRAEPVVASLQSRVDELLVEWPDHPGLLQVYTLQPPTFLTCILYSRSGGKLLLQCSTTC